MLALLLFASGASAWEPVSDKKSVLIERRAEKKGFYEVRATTTAPVTPEQFAATMWNYEAYEKFVPHLKKLRVLQSGGDEKLIYEQIKMPLISDRDYTLHIERHCGANGCETRFETANDK